MGSMVTTFQETDAASLGWVERLARPAVRQMTAYSSARSLVASGGEERLSYLDANELGDAFLAGDVAERRIHRYPEPQPPRLVATLAHLYGVKDAELCVGAGVDAAIDALIRIFCEAGEGGIVITPPTYGYYRVAADIQGARVLEAPLKGQKWALDHGAIDRAVDAGAHLVFVCSPNNPTGHAFPREEILSLAERLSGRAILAVDEAYGEFAEDPSLAGDVGRVPGLVVLRTLSKAWGMAGLRVGSAIAHPAIIQLMHKVRFPYPLSCLSAQMATEILGADPAALIDTRVRRVRAERERLATGLARSPYVASVWPSETNFLLVECRDHAGFLAAAREAKLVVRDRSKEPGLSRAVRITVGSPEENDRLLAAVRAGKETWDS